MDVRKNILFLFIGHKSAHFFKKNMSEEPII